MIPRPSFYTLDDLTEPPERGGWGLTRDQLMTLAEDGQIALSLKTICGVPRDGITATERGRAEQAARGAEMDREPAQHPAQRKSDRYLLGVMAALWLGDDPIMDAHYRVRDQIASDAQVKGIPMLRSRETDANAIKEGLELLRENGYRPRRAAGGMPPVGVEDQPVSELQSDASMPNGEGQQAAAQPDLRMNARSSDRKFELRRGAADHREMIHSNQLRRFDGVA
jgi:hypothetical protein